MGNDTNIFSAENLFLNTSLYEEVPYTEWDEQLILSLKSLYDLNHQFDCYCIECDNDSTFKKVAEINYVDPGTKVTIGSPRRPVANGISSDIMFTVKFSCQRNTSHHYYLSLATKDSSLIKFGQYPSLASIEAAGLKKYRKVLKNDYQDFARAIGLYSHGIGIGSFVYLRRIFENLIEEIHIKKQEEDNWSEDDFRNARMEDKVLMLKDELPVILVQNRKLYSIISKGIHSLSEDECKKLFPSIQVAIELILDEKLHRLEKEAKEKLINEFVSKTVNQQKEKPDN